MMLSEADRTAALKLLFGNDGARFTMGRIPMGASDYAIARYSLNETAGLLVEGFDIPPAIQMPYNPPEYAAFLGHAGYEKLKDLYAWTLDLTQPIDPAMSVP